MRVPKQLMVSTWEDAEAFLVHELGMDPELPPSIVTVSGRALFQPVEAATPAMPTPRLLAVLKPTRGAASMDVVAVSSLKEAKEAFDAILGSSW